MDQRDVWVVIAAFNEALQYESTFARAYSGLADAYFYRGYAWGNLTAGEAMPLSKAAAQKAVELDPNSAEAHTSVALVKLMYDWDWDGAEAEFKRAIELDPNYPTAHQTYGVLLRIIRQDVNGAIAETRKAWELDPLSVPLNNIFCKMLSDGGRAQETIERSKRLLELAPTYSEAYVYLFIAYRQLGKDSEAASAFIKADELRGHANWSGKLWSEYRRGGLPALIRKEAELRIDSYRDHPPRLARWKLDLADAYLNTGDRDSALPWLEQIVQERSGIVIWLNINDVFRAAVSADARYKTLAKTIGFPQT